MERMKKMKKYDAIIIGFGKGGKTLAGFLAGKGQNVALVEKSDKMYGGTCINIGCIPTKKLVDSTKVLKNKGLSGIEEKERFYTESINNKICKHKYSCFFIKNVVFLRQGNLIL